ncbi:MAG: 30S ribosomal protein S4e [Thaumarchaeota archaeon]|nr:30S ribosomal protein S4e [Nitrososphaerota archaeon]
MTGSTKLNRTQAPTFWGVPRKSNHLAPNTSSGSHPKALSIPLIVLIRDVLKLAKTAKEVRTAIIYGGVIVDGVARRTPNFPVGLMDVLEMRSLGKIFRLVPTKTRTLYPIEVAEGEKNLKLCAIKNKVSVRKNMVQYGTHDGRSLLTGPEVNMRVSDSALIEVPSQKIAKHIAMKKGSVVIVTGGERQGEVGTLNAIKLGTVTRPRMANVEINGNSIEIPAELVMVVGDGKPVVTVSVS